MDSIDKSRIIILSIKENWLMGGIWLIGDNWLMRGILIIMGIWILFINGLLDESEWFISISRIIEELFRIIISLLSIRGSISIDSSYKPGLFLLSISSNKFPPDSMILLLMGDIWGLMKGSIFIKLSGESEGLILIPGGLILIPGGLMIDS
jgi:hypothetical protein